MKKELIILLLGLLVFSCPVFAFPSTSVNPCSLLKIGALDPVGGRNITWISADHGYDEEIIGYLQETNDVINPKNGIILIPDVTVIYEITREERKIDDMIGEIITLRVTRVFKVYEDHLVNLEIAGEGYSVSRNPEYKGIRFLTTYVFTTRKTND